MESIRHSPPPRHSNAVSETPVVYVIDDGSMRLASWTKAVFRGPESYLADVDATDPLIRGVLYIGTDQCTHTDNFSAGRLVISRYHCIPIHGGCFIHRSMVRTWAASCLWPS
jgi:hypothetical protein